MGVLRHARRECLGREVVGLAVQPDRVRAVRQTADNHFAKLEDAHPEGARCLDRGERLPLHVEVGPPPGEPTQQERKRMGLYAAAGAILIGLAVMIGARSSSSRLDNLERRAAATQRELERTKHKLEETTRAFEAYREQHAVVVGDIVARGAQPVPVEARARVPPVRERHHRRPVPRLHQRRVELVEGTLLVGEPRLVPPRLGHHLSLIHI